MSKDAVKRSTGNLKRKVLDNEVEEDYDLYEGIKRLYGEDSNSSFDVNNNSNGSNNTAANNSNTCSSEVAKFSSGFLGLTHGKAL